MCLLARAFFPALLIRRPPPLPAAFRAPPFGLLPAPPVGCLQMDIVALTGTFQLAIGAGKKLFGASYIRVNIQRYSDSIANRRTRLKSVLALGISLPPNLFPARAHLRGHLTGG